MNFLRRELAPISQTAWAEIDAMARQTLSTYLSGRRIVDLDGPHGPACASVSLGRLSVPKDQDVTTVKYGVHQVLPLVESRVSFRLSIWELDNADRGAKDVDLHPLVKACQDIASFENKTIYNGLASCGMSGLQQAAADRIVPIALNPESIIEATAKGRGLLRKAGVSGPCNLAVSIPLWAALAQSVPGGTLRTVIESQIGGSVIFSADVKDALLVSARGGDAELTVGQDIAIGYHSHSSTEVELYLTESFAFRVIAPEAVVGFTLR